MTNQEAIEKLVNAEFADKYQGDQDLTTAMHMAIDALKSGPVRSHWAKTVLKNRWECESCHEQCNYHSRYCPACGAKMDLRTQTEAALDMADSVMMGGADND